MAVHGEAVERDLSGDDRSTRRLAVTSAPLGRDFDEAETGGKPAVKNTSHTTATRNTAKLKSCSSKSLSVRSGPSKRVWDNEKTQILKLG